MENKTELQKKNILRQNNEEVNAITRECIESALILLMEEKSFQDISITDITSRAGVSRNAYYRNYSSKEDILSKYLRNISMQISTILKKYDALTETQESWTALLSFVKDFSSQYRLLLKAGYRDKLREEFQLQMDQNTPADNYTRHYSNCYWAGAICAILTEWVQNDMDVPIHELAEIGCCLMHDGIKTIEKYGNSCI